MTHTPRRTATFIAASTLTLAFLSSPAAASAAAAAVPAVPPAATIDASAWEPVPAPPFLLPAGEVCSFPVAGEFPVNEQRAFVVRNPDGSKRFEYITGRLVGQFTNVTTGETVSRDLSGSGAFSYRPDGSLQLVVVGGALVGFHGGDSPSNVLEVNGPRSVLVVDFTADGQRTRTRQLGPYEDLCVTLT